MLRVFQEGWSNTDAYFDNGPGGTEDIHDSNVWRKLFYGFGDKNTYSRVYKLTGSAGNSWDIKGNTNCPADRGLSGGYPTAPITIRGWKYGIQNGFAENTNSVFRRDRFGQFRDMLEQRTDGKFYKKTDSVTRAYFGTNTNDSPIQVRFVDSEGNIVEPHTTNCSNLHFEATSSLPYFDDGILRNRAPVVDEDIRTIAQVLNLTTTV